MGITMKPAGSTCTKLEEREKTTYALLPPAAKGYLTEKVEYALKAPKTIVIVKLDGSTTTHFLKQVVVSAAIRVQEELAAFLFEYKAEVSFDMTPLLDKTPGLVPVPFLSTTNKTDGPNRRHTLNPFPPGFTPGELRRPDVIVVTNPAVRWPGRAAVDHDGAFHGDNLMRLVEIKFPGDSWGKGQEDSYALIAGGTKRMSVVDVTDCDGERVRQPSTVPAPQPETQDEKQKRLRAPIRSSTPIAEPVFYEKWLPDMSEVAHRIGEAVDEAEQAIASLGDQLAKGARELSDETQAWLHQHAAWLFTAGKWIHDKASDAWTWVSEKGEVLARYTIAQLKAAWQEIRHVTDLVWEQLKQIDWLQIATTILKGLAVVVVVIAGVVAAVVLAEALALMLTALVSIIAAASVEALAALTIGLGVTAVTSAAGR